jgi:hypothetical protein
MFGSWLSSHLVIHGNATTIEIGPSHNDIGAAITRSQSDLKAHRPPACRSTTSQAAAAAGSTHTQSPTQTGSGPAEIIDGPPIIAINGDNPATIPIGATYAGLGAQITAPQQDLNLGLITLLDGATTTSIQLDTTRPGEHTILYTGLSGTASRTVTVSAPANDNQATSSPPAPPIATTTPVTASNDNTPIVPLSATGSAASSTGQ